MKYIKIAIIAISIIITILIIYLISINNINNNSINTNNFVLGNTNNISTSNSNSSVTNYTENNTSENQITIEEQENYGDEVTYTGEIEEVTSANMFFIIENIVQDYINNIVNKNNIALYYQLSSEYILTNGITEENILNYVENISETQEFRALKMNCVTGDVYNQYSVYGKLVSSTGITSKMYLIVNLNSGNLSYSIIPQMNKSYADISEVSIMLTEEEITKNSYNSATYKIVNDEDIIKNIMNDYQKNVLYDTQSAYSSLDEKYSTARFEDYADYFKYVKNNISKILELTLTKYSKTENIGYTEYVCKDNYGNTYTIKATGIVEYTIILDNYTLEDTTDYTYMSDEEKIEENINKLLKMINTCDYTHIYKKLNDNFKSNNFPTQDEFENYVKANWFEYNVLDTIEINEYEEDVYIVNIIVKNKNTVSADTMNLSIIMKLKGEANFEMSFNIE